MTDTTNQTGQEAIMAEFKPKKSHIDIIYTDKTVSYRDIKGYSLNGPYLVVQLPDDAQYVYPMSAVSSLKLFVTE